MASSKKRKKESKLAREQKAGGRKAGAHPDGDRRRRGLSIRVEDAIAAKRFRQTFPGPLPPEEGAG
jgi:hypothetical protein